MNIQEYTRSQSEARELVFRNLIPSRMLQIANRVCWETDVSLADLKGPCRERHLVRARWVFMRRAHSEGISTTRIGRFLGNRDHTTVLHGLRQMKLIRDGEIPHYHEAELR